MANWRMPASALALAAVLVSCETKMVTSPASLSSFRSEACTVVPDRHEAASDVVLNLDPTRGEFPEGIAVDHRGDIYVGLRFTGVLLRFRPGTASEVVTRFAAVDADGDPLPDQGLLGLATDHRGNVYAAVASFDPATGAPASSHGVWRITPAGDRELLPGSAQIFFPNALTFDRRGNLYVSSSTGPPTGPGAFEEGGVWKVAPGGSAALWFRGPELTGTGDVAPGPFPIGANGIVHHGSSLFVASTEKRQLVELPIRPDGGAGPARVAAILGVPGGPNPFAGVVDGLGVDACGNLYPVLIGESRLVRVSPDGSTMETVADAQDGLQTPTSVAFGAGNGATDVFIAEFAALAPLLGQQPDPKVVRVRVGVPGPDAR